MNEGTQDSAEHARTVTIYDPTLRDGHHAVRHQLSHDQLRHYAAAANAARIPVVEIGHGNGLGASSLQAGRSALTDDEMLTVVREQLSYSKMGVFLLPGWGTLRDLKEAINHGADVVRVGAHCTESDTMERYLDYLGVAGVEAQGVLVMSHMATPERLAQECRRMVDFGASAVGIMDSAGHYLPEDVSERIAAIAAAVDVPIIFHGHNNLGMSVANSVAAVRAGATIIDGCARGFGAGAGNTQLEVLVPVLERYGFSTGVDLYALLDAADLAERELMPKPPTIDSVGIVSGLSGVFSGFKNRVLDIASQQQVDPRDIFFELGRRQAVAGQEDLIIDVALELSGRRVT
ncbi:MAG: 4-hydroxy-2-oxovalerate aldolase [Jatrophihabitantaceae bacterium]